MSTGFTLNLSSEEALEVARLSLPMITGTVVSKDGDSKRSGVPGKVKGVRIKQSNKNSEQRLDKDVGKSNTLVAKGTPLSMEQLWNGTLQLNTSVSVSIVAFFKSGERMPDVKWSKSVEVKGKVKLEAFEKYIQDLPRSRNRGLTVISLCWKQGSSKTRLEGIKKVAKKYKEENRVGLAKVSPGIDLYVCPRSETIITILAKHGFFKGMAAIEDNKNSLIGCIVWRRNQTDSKCFVEKPKNDTLLSGKSVSTPSNLSIQRDAVNNVLSAPPVPEPTRKQMISESDMSRDRAERAGRPTSSNSSLLPANSISTSPPSLSLIPKTAFSDSQSEVSGEELSKVKDLLTSNLGQEQDRRLELQLPTLSFPSDVKNRALHLLDIDDLPEFDFGAPRGISTSLTEKPLAAVTFDRKFPDGLSRNKEELLQLTTTVTSLNSWPVPSHIRDLKGLASDDHEKMPPLKRACTAKVIFPKLQNQQSTAMGITGSISGDPRRRNLFNDGDDDMPEWSPPCIKQSLANTHTPSSKTNLFYSREPRSTPHDSSAVPRSLQQLPYPLATAAHPPLYHRGFQSASRHPLKAVQREVRPLPTPLPGVDGKFSAQH